MAKLAVFVLTLVVFALFSESLGYRKDKDKQKSNEKSNEKSDEKEPKCPEHEVWVKCGRPCQTICNTLGLKCGKKSVKCIGGCYCKAGWARIKPGGKCVEQDDCPRIGCSTNEVWLECGQAPACDNWCDVLNEKCMVKPKSCPRGCYCKKGYARCPKTKKCVPIKDCKYHDSSSNENDSKSK